MSIAYLPGIIFVNAVFDVIAPDDKTIKQEAIIWSGKLPANRDYQIVIAGSGNATLLINANYSYFQLIEPQIFVGARQCRAPTVSFIYPKTAVSNKLANYSTSIDQNPT